MESPYVLPQSATQLDTEREIGPDETRIRVQRLNLDAASFRQLREQHQQADALRHAVLEIITERGKMHNPVTGSGGMLIGTVQDVGPEAELGLQIGDHVATLVSLTLTPLVITDGLQAWDGTSEQVPCDGYAILFGRSIAARLPDDLDEELSLAALDVCGAPALTARLVRSYPSARVGVLGAAGKSGSLSLAAATQAGASETVGVVPDETEAAMVAESGLASRVVVADATDPIAVGAAVGDPFDVTVVCVDAPGCEGSAILSTAQQGTVIFFSMATSFSAAALGAEGLAADITMVIGNGYVPGHAEYALGLLRSEPGVRGIFEQRLER